MVGESAQFELLVRSGLAVRCEDDVGVGRDGVQTKRFARERSPSVMRASLPSVVHEFLRFFLGLLAKGWGWLARRHGRLNLIAVSLREALRVPVRGRFSPLNGDEHFRKQRNLDAKLFLYE
jgi:hypothetical protein